MHQTERIRKRSVGRVQPLQETLNQLSMPPRQTSPNNRHFIVSMENEEKANGKLLSVYNFKQQMDVKWYGFALCMFCFKLQDVQHAFGWQIKITALTLLHCDAESGQ